MADDLTLHGVKKLPVLQLRKELEKRNLERSGCKSDLVSRLEDHLETANLAKAIAASLDEKTKEEESQSDGSGPSSVPLDESITNDLAVSALPALEKSLEAESVGGEDDVLVSTTSKIADENSSALEKSECIENSVFLSPKSADVVTIDDNPENMSLEMIKNFTVVRLRQELGKRGLDKSGLKNDLVLRLETHFQECADGEKVEKISLETEPADEAQAKDSALPCDVQAPAMDSQLEIHTPVDEKSETVLETQPHSEIKLPSETDPGEDIELCKKVEIPETKSPEEMESATDIETSLEDKYVTSENVDSATEMDDSPEVKSITEKENPPEDESTFEMENSPDLESDTEMEVPLELESVESVEKTVDGENLPVESSVSNISDEESVAQEERKKAKYTENSVPPIHTSVEVIEDETETIRVEMTSKTEAHSETNNEDNQKSSKGPDVVILGPKPATETEKSVTGKFISPINTPCLWVSGLDPKVNAVQLKDHFTSFGRVLVSKIISHPENPGVHYGFVIVLNYKIARSCVYCRHKSTLQNKIIYVEQVRTTGPRKREYRIQRKLKGEQEKAKKQQRAKQQRQAKRQPQVQHQGEKQQIQLQDERPQHTNQQQGEKQQLDIQQQPLKQKQEVQEQCKKAKAERELFLKRRREQEKQEELILQKKIRQKIEIDLQEKKQAKEKSRESSKQERESRVEREPTDGPIQEKKHAKEKSHESSKQEIESRVVREPKDGPKNDLPHSVTDPAKDSEDKRELEQQECFIRELKRRNDEQKLQGKQKLEKLRRECDRLEDDYHQARKNQDRARCNILKDELDRKTLEYKIRKELEDEARSRYAKEEQELKDRLDKERRDRVERELREKIAQEIREREESERAERAERERIETEKLDREEQERKNEAERKRKVLESERYEKDWGEKLKGKSIVNRGLGLESSEGDRLEEEYRQFTSSLSNTHSIVPERKRQSLDNTTVVQQHHQQQHQNRQALEPAERFSSSNQTRNRSDNALGYQNSPQAYNTGNTQYSRTNNMNSNMNGTFYSGNNQALQVGNNENNQVLRDIAVRNGPLELTFDGRYKPASGQRPQRNTGFSCMK